MGGATEEDSEKVVEERLQLHWGTLWVEGGGGCLQGQS